MPFKSLLTRGVVGFDAGRCVMGRSRVTTGTKVSTVKISGLVGFSGVWTVEEGRGKRVRRGWSCIILEENQHLSFESTIYGDQAYLVQGGAVDTLFPDVQLFTFAAYGTLKVVGSASILAWLTFWLSFPGRDQILLCGLTLLVVSYQTRLFIRNLLLTSGRSLGQILLGRSYGLRMDWAWLTACPVQ